MSTHPFGNSSVMRAISEYKCMSFGTLSSLEDNHRGVTYLLEELLEFVGELTKVAGGDEAAAGLLQAVTRQLDDLVVGEAEDAIGQWQHALRGVGADDLPDPLLHLGRGLCKMKERDTEKERETEEQEKCQKEEGGLESPADTV